MAKWLRIEECQSCPYCDDVLWCKIIGRIHAQSKEIDPRCKLPDAPEEEGQPQVDQNG